MYHSTTQLVLSLTYLKVTSTNIVLRLNLKIDRTYALASANFELFLPDRAIVNLELRRLGCAIVDGVGLILVNHVSA